MATKVIVELSESEIKRLDQVCKVVVRPREETIRFAMRNTLGLHNPDGSPEHQLTEAVEALGGYNENE